MSCSGTSTLTRGNAGRLCTGAAVATETDSPQDKSVRVGVGRRGVVKSTSQITDERNIVNQKFFIKDNILFSLIVVQKNIFTLPQTLSSGDSNPI